MSSGGTVAEPTVTVVVPNLDQGRFLAEAIESILAQEVSPEIFVMDGGSTDASLDVIRRFEGRLAGWTSGPDGGQAEAINRGMALGRAPLVTWLNADDLLLPGALGRAAAALRADSAAPFAFGRVWNDREGRRRELPVRPFDRRAFARRCTVSQPGTVVRRDCWDRVGGVDRSLHLAFDYDLWWKLAALGRPAFVDSMVAVNRDHPDTKTNRLRRRHYRESIEVVRRHAGHAPLRWWLKQPYTVWWRGWRSGGSR